MFFRLYYYHLILHFLTSFYMLESILKRPQHYHHHHIHYSSSHTRDGDVESNNISVAGRKLRGKKFLSTARPSDVPVMPRTETSTPFDNLLNMLFLTRSYVHAMNLYSVKLAQLKKEKKAGKLKSSSHTTATSFYDCSSLSLLTYENVRGMFERKITLKKQSKRRWQDEGSSSSAKNENSPPPESVDWNWKDSRGTNPDYYPEFANSAHTTIVMGNTISDYIRETLNYQFNFSPPPISKKLNDEEEGESGGGGKIKLNFTEAQFKKNDSTRVVNGMMLFDLKNQDQSGTNIRLTLHSMLKGVVESDPKIFGAVMAFGGTEFNFSLLEQPVEKVLDDESVKVKLVKIGGTRWAPAVFKKRKKLFAENISNDGSLNEDIQQSSSSPSNEALVITDITKYYDFTSTRVDRAQWFWNWWYRNYNIEETSDINSSSSVITDKITLEMKRRSVPIKNLISSNFNVDIARQERSVPFERKLVVDQKTDIKDEAIKFNSFLGRVNLLLLDDIDYNDIWRNSYWPLPPPHYKSNRKTRISTHNNIPPVRHAIKFVPKDLSNPEKRKLLSSIAVKTTSETTASTTTTTLTNDDTWNLTKASSSRRLLASSSLERMFENLNHKLSAKTAVTLPANAKDDDIHWEYHLRGGGNKDFEDLSQIYSYYPPALLVKQPRSEYESTEPDFFLTNENAQQLTNFDDRSELLPNLQKFTTLFPSTNNNDRYSSSNIQDTSHNIPNPNKRLLINEDIILPYLNHDVPRDPEPDDTRPMKKDPQNGSGGPGIWSHPFIDCKLGRIWLVAYSVPVFLDSSFVGARGKGDDIPTISTTASSTTRPSKKDQKILIGVVAVFLDLRYLDVDQCDNGTGLFAGTHLCDEATECIAIKGRGFTYGNYDCKCKNAFISTVELAPPQQPTIPKESNFVNETVTPKPSVNTTKVIMVTTDAIGNATAEEGNDFLSRDLISMNLLDPFDELITGPENKSFAFAHLFVSSPNTTTAITTTQEKDSTPTRGRLLGKTPNLRKTISETVKKSHEEKISQYYSLIPKNFYDRTYQGIVLEETFAHDVSVINRNPIYEIFHKNPIKINNFTATRNYSNSKVAPNMPQHLSGGSGNQRYFHYLLYSYTSAVIIRNLYGSLIDTDVHLTSGEFHKRYNQKPKTFYEIYDPIDHKFVRVPSSTLISGLVLGGMYSPTPLNYPPVLLSGSSNNFEHPPVLIHLLNLTTSRIYYRQQQVNYTGTSSSSSNNQLLSAAYGSSIYKCFSCGRIRCMRCPSVFCFARYNPGIRGPPLALQTFCMTLTFAMMILIFKTRKIKIINYAMWTLLEMILLGAFILYATVIIEFFYPTTITCFIGPWLREIGFGLMYGAIILKLYKLYVDFQSRKAHRIHVRDKDLLKYLMAVLTVLTGYMSAWTFVNLDRISEEGGSMLEVGITKSNLLYYICKSLWWDYVIEIGEFLFLIFGLYYSWRIRTSKAYRSEIWALKISLCVEAFVSSVMYLIKHLTLYNTHSDYIFLLHFFRTQFTVTIVLFLIFFPKLWKLFNIGGPGDKRIRGISTTDGTDFVTPEAIKLRDNLTSNGNIDFNDISISDMDPEEIRSELKRVYMQLQILKNKNMRKDNPHISKRRGGRKAAHSRRFSLQAFHHHPQGLLIPSGSGGGGMVNSHSSQDNSSTTLSKRDSGGGSSSVTRSIGSVIAQDMKNLLTTHLAYEMRLQDNVNAASQSSGNLAAENVSAGSRTNFPTSQSGLPYARTMVISPNANAMLFEKISEGDEETEIPKGGNGCRVDTGNYITGDGTKMKTLSSQSVNIPGRSQNVSIGNKNDKRSPHSPSGPNDNNNNLLLEESSAIIYEDTTTTTTNTTTSNSNIHGATTKSSSSISANNADRTPDGTPKLQRKSSRQNSQKSRTGGSQKRTLAILTGILKKGGGLGGGGNSGSYLTENNMSMLGGSGGGSNVTSGGFSFRGTVNKLRRENNGFNSSSHTKNSGFDGSSSGIKNKKSKPTNKTAKKRISESVNSEITQSNNNSEISKTPDSSSN